MTEHVRNLIHITTADAITELHINRPQKRNALTQAMYTVMADALAEADADPSVRVIILTGYNPDPATAHAGPAPVFTAGNDLADFTADFRMDDASPVFRFLFGLLRTQKPVVAAVNGVAVGVGVTLLLHCDLVLAGRSARFQLPFINLGLVPEGGSSLLLPQLAGHRRAAELLMLGEPFDAVTAREIGLINRIVDDADLLAAARATARSLAVKPPEALRTTKQLLRAPVQAELEQVMRAEGHAFAAALQGPEAAAALQAFFARRA